MKNFYLLPTIDDLFDQLVGSSVFYQLDLATRFYQLRFINDSIYKTTFKTPDGFFKWLVMPFGLTDAPTHFVDLMSRIFRDVLKKFVVLFVNDILVFSQSMEEHVIHLEEVLCTVLVHQLKIKFSKFRFWREKMRFFFGHVL